MRMRPDRKQRYDDLEGRMRRAQIDAVARQRGGRALLTANLLFDRERAVRALIEATTDEAERARLTSQADELGRLAREEAEEGKDYTAMRTIQQIIENAQKQFRDIAQRYAAVSEKGDEQVPPSDRPWRSQQRADLRREWQRVEAGVYAEATSWRNEEQQRHLTAYHSDPLGDAAAETRRLREEQEIAGIVAQFAAQPKVAVKNRVLAQVQDMLAAQNPQRARVFLEAAKRLGVESGRLDQVVKTTIDETTPHRKAALEGLGNIAKQVDNLRLAVVTERQAAGIGTTADRARDSSYRKMIEWRQQVGLIPVEGGAPAPDATGSGAAE